MSNKTPEEMLEGFTTVQLRTLTEVVETDDAVKAMHERHQREKSEILAARRLAVKAALRAKVPSELLAYVLGVSRRRVGYIVKPQKRTAKSRKT